MDNQTIIGKFKDLVLQYGTKPAVRKIADLGASTLVSWHLITETQNQSFSQKSWPWIVAFLVWGFTWVLSMLEKRDLHTAPPPFTPPASDPNQPSLFEKER